MQVKVVLRLEPGQLAHGLDVLVEAGADKVDKVVASFMHHKRATLALVALDADTPHKVLAVRAKCGLLEKSGHKSVVLDHAHVALLEGSLSQTRPHLGLFVCGPIARTSPERPKVSGRDAAGRRRRRAACCFGARSAGWRRGHFRLSEPMLAVLLAVLVVVMVVLVLTELVFVARCVLVGVNVLAGILVVVLVGRLHG